MSDGAEPRPGVPGRGRAPLQPAAGRDDELPRAHEHLERLLADSQLLTELQWSGYADPVWQPVAAEFARYGLGVLTAWIGTGRIYRQVLTKTGYRLTGPEHGLDDDAVQSLATDTTMDTLGAFLENVLKQNRWDPARGASLKTFFIGQAMFQFPNVYRRWLTQQRREAWVQFDGSAMELPDVEHSAPADREVLSREQFDTTLALLSTKDARTAFAMASMGYSHDEIAAQLGLLDAKAVENLLGYQRRRLQQQTTRRHA
jgi:DNA-directed RNA polymerase specialized sigma24 family protein